MRPAMSPTLSSPCSPSTARMRRRTRSDRASNARFSGSMARNRITCRRLATYRRGSAGGPPGAAGPPGGVGEVDPDVVVEPAAERVEPAPRRRDALGQGGGVQLVRGRPGGPGVEAPVAQQVEAGVLRVGAARPGL